MCHTQNRRFYDLYVNPNPNNLNPSEPDPMYVCGSMFILIVQHLRVVAEHKDLVLDCLEDEDPTIRRRAIDIITRMVSRKNMGGIVRRLLKHLTESEGDYRNYVMSRIIDICSQENFAYISDFAWYVETLLELTVMVGTNKENSLALKTQ